MRCILAAVLVVASLRSAAAGTPKDAFAKAVQKVAPAIGSVAIGKPKALCYCNATTQVGAVASLVTPTDVIAVCNVPTFLPDGTVDMIIGCAGWTPLAK